MIVKGIIKTINYNDNSCTVRLPLFETAAAQGEVILNAIFMSQPGMYNGYAENDVVFVDFENDRLDSPIVIGKLYLGATAETASAKKGGITVSSLNVSSDATLPVNTKIAVDRVATVADVDGGITSYKSIADIIKALRNNGSSIERLDKQNNELKDEGISSIKIEYLSQPRENHTPSANDKSWQISSPEYKDGYAIWQKTTWLNYRGQILNTEIICLSELASSATYRIKCSTRVHYGKQQKDALVVTAMAKFGSDFETEDKRDGISLAYRWESDKEETTVKKSKFTIELANIKNETLFITAKYNGDVYDTETITYVPLNTPTLSLSKDSSFIEYDSYGLNKIDSNSFVQSTASVKLNNEELSGVTFSWELDGCTAEKDETSKEEILDQKTIVITDIDQDVDIAYATCKATYNDNLGKSKTLTKTFTIAKNKQGKSFYKIDIFNDSVTISTDENGIITNSMKPLLPTWSTHNISCYYGDDLLTISEYVNAKNATISDWQNDTNFRVVYNAQNVTIIANNAPTFAISNLSADIGYITYTLYRGTNRVAVSKFEIAKQRQGVAATSYWVDYSARVHKGINQQDPITATAWTKYGSDASVQNDNLQIRYGWRQEDGNFGEYSEPDDGQITVDIAEFKNADLIFELGTVKTLVGGESYFDVEDSEIITYSPIETPVLDLSNDSATLVYKPNGEKIGEATVSSTATVYLDGQELTEGVTYAWSNGSTTISTAAKLEVSILTNETEEFTCTATIDNAAIFKNPVTLTKVFTVSKQIQGENSISYWLKLSSGVHLGANQQKTITVTAMQKVGTNAAEDIDESAILKYSFDGTNWLPVSGRIVGEGENAKTYYDTFDSSTIDEFKFKDSDLLIRAYHGDVVYETETITYSPLNTPTLDLDNDTDTILYSADGTQLLGAPVSSTATLYLNGDPLAATYSWSLENCSTSVTEDINSQTITIATLKADTARAVCTATVTAEGAFQGKTYTKAFTVSKTRKGDNAVNYSLVLNCSSIKVNPNLGTKVPEKLVGTWYIHNGESIQPFKTKFEYKIDTAASFTDWETDDNGKFEITENINTEIVLRLNVNGITVKNETISVIRDGENAVSPYTIDIFNDQASALSETKELSNYEWKENTEHRIKILQGSNIIGQEYITVKTAPYSKSDEDTDLVLTYNLINIRADQFKAGDHTNTEKIYYISGTEDNNVLKSKIEYNLYYKGTLVATNKFEFLKILTGVSITGVTNKYYATKTSTESLPDKSSDSWKDTIGATLYGPETPYLWNYEIINYSSGNPTTTVPALIGSRGKGIKALSEYYLLTNTADIPTKPTKDNVNGWQTGESAQTYPTASNPYLWNSEKIEYTDGDVEFTDPALIGTYSRSITEVKNYYYATTSETATLPKRGNDDWKTTITATGFNATNKYLWNYEEIIYDRALTDGSNDKSKTTAPELISIWSKEIDYIEELYQISDSLDSTSLQDANWDEELVVPTSEKPYLWNKETTYYTDGTNESTNPIIISTFARSITGVKNYYIATKLNINTADPLSQDSENNYINDPYTTTWQESINAAGFNATYKYLWNYEEIAYDLPLSSGESTSKTAPEIISVWSKSIDRIEEWYLISKSNDKNNFASDNNASGAWSTTAVSPNSTYPYLWNYEKTIYSDGEEKVTDPIIIGTYGETFGVNIIPSVSSIKYRENADGSKTYTPETLSLEFKEISGTAVINCGESTKRAYKYKISKIEGSTTTPLVTETRLNAENTTITFSIADNQTTGIYQIQLLLNNNGEWVVVTTEDIQTIREGNNGADGVSIVSQITYYALIHPNASAGDIITPDNSDEGLKIKANKNLESGAIAENGYPLYNIWSVEEKWNTTPPAHTPTTIREGWKYWTTVRTEKSDGNVWFSTPIINEEVSGAYALAQGKSTNYYSDNDPNNGTNIIKEGDCWFDTNNYGYEVYSGYTLFKTVEDYIGYFVASRDANNKISYSEITSENLQIMIDNRGITVGEKAYIKVLQPTLKQWTGSEWTDIGTELVANKVTANYINALDITAKKIEVLDSTNSNILFKADGLNGKNEVKIAGFNIDSNTISNGSIGQNGSVFVSTGKIATTDIGSSTGEKTWAFTAGNDFGVTTSGTIYANKIILGNKYQTQENKESGDLGGNISALSAQITAASAVINNIKSNYVTTENLNAVSAKIDNLRVTKDGGDPNKDEDLIFKADGRKIDDTGTNGPKSDDDRVKIGGWNINTDTIYKKCQETYSGICAATAKFSDGLEYEQITDYYKVMSIGTCTESDIIIPDWHNYLPVKAISLKAFDSCQDLKSVIIPKNVVRIDKQAFYNCSSLWSVEIRGTLAQISYGTFDGCSRLISINIPAGTEVIEQFAFKNCSSLKSIALPKSITQIQQYAFMKCSALKDIYYEGTESDWNNINIWDDAINLTNITLHYDSELPQIVKYTSLVNANSDPKPRFFAGAGSIIPQSVNDAKFLVLDDGSLYANAAKLSGEVIATSGEIASFKLAGDSLWSTNTNAGSYFGPITTDSFTINNLETGNITTLSGQERVAIATGIWDSDGRFTAESMLHGGDIVGENISGKFVQARRIESEYLNIDKTFSCGKVSIEGGGESDSFVRCSGLKSNYRRTDDQVGEFSDNAIILNFKGNETYYRFKLSLSGRELTLYFQSKLGYSSTSTWQNTAYNGSGGTLTIYYSTKGWGWPIVLGKKNNVSKEISLAKVGSSGFSFTADGNGDVHSYYIYDSFAPSSRSTTLDWRTDTSDKAFNIGITGNVLPTVTANNAGFTGSGYNLGSGSNVWNTVYRKEASTSSDRRIKKEINYDLSKYDDFFDSLQPASYKYTNNTSNRVHVGFIAQDIEQELFNNNLNRRDLAIIDITGEGFDASSDTILDNDKTSYFVRYDQLHALNVYQIQKLKKRVSEQEATIKLLEDRIKALEEKIK